MHEQAPITRTEYPAGMAQIRHAQRESFFQEEKETAYWFTRLFPVYQLSYFSDDKPEGITNEGFKGFYKQDLSQLFLDSRNVFSSVFQWGMTTNSPEQFANTLQAAGTLGEMIDPKFPTIVTEQRDEFLSRTHTPEDASFAAKELAHYTFQAYRRGTKDAGRILLNPCSFNPSDGPSAAVEGSLCFLLNQSFPVPVRAEFLRELSRLRVYANDPAMKDAYKRLFDFQASFWKTMNAGWLESNFSHPEEKQIRTVMDALFEGRFPTQQEIVQLRFSPSGGRETVGRLSGMYETMLRVEDAGQRQANSTRQRELKAYIASFNKWY